MSLCDIKSRLLTDCGAGTAFADPMRMDIATGFDRSEHFVRSSVEWLRLLIESIGALVIAVGLVVAIVLVVRSVLVQRRFEIVQVRLSFARHLAFALELQLAADILSTAIAPSWDRIGKLAAIAIIRTALNYFLMIEMRSETRGDASAAPDARAPNERAAPQ
jgi:uncharacterized membrane protein